ncbi:MAG TPA: ribosome maturation factor RimM [Stellaceae bacterium]|nr:ribosome maturation factor RimM [Stellaceae bacterium]
MPADPDRRVLMGVITAAHGIKGAVKVMSYAATPEDIAAYGPLEDQGGARRFSLALVGKVRGALLAEIEGVTDRTAAEKLRGTRLYLPRSALPDLAEGEFYWDDLVGLRAELRDGAVLGRVKAVHDYGAGASLEVEREGGGVVMVPFSTRVVPVVELERGRLVIDPPEGLFDNRPVEAEAEVGTEVEEDAGKAE